MSSTASSTSTQPILPSRPRFDSCSDDLPIYSFNFMRAVFYDDDAAEEVAIPMSNEPSWGADPFEEEPEEDELEAPTPLPTRD